MDPELIQILENVKEYCEDKAICDKLRSYGDFYYEIVVMLKKERAAIRGGVTLKRECGILHKPNG